MDNDSINFHNIVDSIEHDYRVKKVKESMLLLKRKMCKTHDLIKQYSENMNEIDHLKSDLEVAKKEAKHMISNYSSAMDKIRELELKIVEDKQSNEKLINKINEYEINIAADKQNMQQLTCKIKELEENRSAKVMEYNLEKSSFEDKIKDLEHELKMLKKGDIQNATYKKKEKKIISPNVDMTKPSTKSSSDIGINVSLCDIESSVKCEVRDQNIMTDEFYHTKNDPHPLFCAKCEAHLPPDLTPEKIFKTMTTYPKLIEKDLSPPKKIYSPSYSTYPNFTNRNEDTLSKISSVPHLSPYSPYSDSIVGNLKPQSGRSSAMTQICDNVELRNTDISHIPVVNLSNNLSSIPTALTLSENRNCAREDFYSNDLLTKHSSSIKEMERKIRSLKSKMKKLRKLRKKNTDSHRCCVNHKDDVSLNSNLISLICKGMAEYFNEKREACSKNEYDVDSEKCICCVKKTKLNRRQSNKCNTCENTFSRIENFDENDRVRDVCCNKIANATKVIGSQSEHILPSTHNSYSNINIVDTSLNDIDETDKEEFLHEQNTLHSAEVAPVEDNLTISRLSIDKTCISNNILNKDNVEINDTNNQIETISLSNDKKFPNHANSRIIDIYAEKSEIERKNQNIHEDKSSEISDNFLNKDIVNAIDMDNQTEIGSISLSNSEDSADHIGETVDNAEKNKIERKDQSIHKDMISEKDMMVSEICISNILSDKNNVEAIDTDQIESRTTFLNDINFNDHAYSKIIDTNSEENKIKIKSQNIHKDKIDEIYINDNLLNKNNVEMNDTDNQIETRTILSNNENSSTADDKIVNNNTVEIKRSNQNIYKDEIGKINTSDNDLSKNNIEAVDMDNETETRMTSSVNNENSINLTDKNIVISVKKDKITRKGQNIQKNKVGDRLLKNLRNLKRKTQPTSHINKQENIEPYSNHNSEYIESTKKSRIENEEKINNCSLNYIRNLKRNLDTQESTNEQKDEKDKLCSDHCESMKKLRIAHTPKTPVQLNNGNDFTHCMVRNIATLAIRRKNNENQQLNTHKDLLAKSKNPTRNMKCDEKNIVKSIETNSIDKKLENEKDLVIAKNCLQNNNDITSSVIDIEHVSEFEKCDGVLIESTIDKSISMDKLIEKTSNNSDVSYNIINDTANNLELEESVLRTSRIITRSISKDLKHDKLSETLETIKVKKDMSSTSELEYASEIFGNKSHNDYKISKDAISNNKSSVLYDRSNVFETTRSENHCNSYIPDGSIEVPRSPSPRDSGIIEEDYTNDNNMKESLDEIKNTTKKREEMCVNNKTFGIQTIKPRRIVRANQQGKETKLSSHHVEESQSHNDIPNETIHSPEVIPFIRSPSPRDSDIVEDHTNDNNMTESLDKIKNATKKREEMCVNNEIFEARTTKPRRIVRTSQRGKETKLSSHHVEESQSHNDIPNETIHSPEVIPFIRSPSPRDSDIIVEDHTDDNNMMESLDKIKNATKKREEMCVNNEIFEARTTKPRRIVRTSQRGKETKLSSHHVEESQSHNDIPNETIHSPEVIPFIRSPSPRDSDIIVEDYTDDNNMKESLDKIKNATKKREEMCVNNETFEARTTKPQRIVCASQRNIETELITHHIDKFQSHNDISNETVRSPEVIPFIRSPSPEDNDVIFENCINDSNVKESVYEIKNARKKRKETCINNRTIEIQAIKTQNKNVHVNQQNKKLELISVSHDIKGSQTPMSRLHEYIKKKKYTKKKLSHKEIKYACKITDKFVKNELQKLMNSAWEDSIHDDVKAKLESTCGPRIIAKCIVEFIIKEVDHREALDRSFTPPAPLMTRFEQKIITLLFDLEISKPTVIYFVQAIIEYHLFRLKSDVKDPIDSLTRIYVVLSRIRKDREKIRMMCCNALYCMNLKSVGVLYTILTCWPEVLPNAEANKGILTKCIAFLIISQCIDDPEKDRVLKKLNTLKSMISRFYNYVYLMKDDIFMELMTALKAERIDGLDTAIILLAKREGASWTYKNIIESTLLPMIIKNEHPCIYSAFSLLGRLLRAFPLKDKIVHDIFEQLCDLIQSGEGSHDQQEGIISALLSLSRHKFDDIIWPILKWTPSKSLRPIVDVQLQEFLHARPSNFWKNYLKNKNIKCIQSKV